MKTAIVFWSMTSNTQAMAYAIKEGIKNNCDIFEVSQADPQKIAEYDSIALGCPAMGAEVLEENEFEPFFNELLPLLKNQKVFLFGSYDWGNGLWMKNWQETCKENNVNLIENGYIVNLEPDGEDLENLKKIGEKLSK